MMNTKAYALATLLLASIASVALVGAAYAQQSVTIETDKTDYQAGDTIILSGSVGTIQTGQPPLLLQVFNPNGAAYRFDSVPVAADGTWTYSLNVGGRLGIAGEYRAVASYSGAQDETTFNFTAAEEGWLIATLFLEDSTYDIQYQIEGGTLDDLYGDPDFATIFADITPDEEGGQLIIQLPRHIVDAVDEDGEDTDYIIFLDDVPDEEGFAEDDFGEDVRELIIDFNADTTSIDIVGTFVVPEFGTITAIVLAVAIVATIVATAKYSKFKSLLPRR